VGLVVCAFNVLICGLFLTLLYFLKKKGEQMVKLWDMKTVTISDYSVEFPISEAAWNEWKTTWKSGESSGSMIYEFKLKMIQFIEQLITSQPSQFK